MTSQAKREYRMLLNSVETELLDIASLYNQCTTSDLQSVAFAKAEKIIEYVRQYEYTERAKQNDY